MGNEIKGITIVVIKGRNEGLVFENNRLISWCYVMGIRIVLPDKVEYILQKLNENNYDGYVVGGCVRDSILGRQPGDYDIATNALPNRVSEIFGPKKTMPTGIKYGTVTVIVDGETFEVTTYRIDLNYSDGRRPDEVVFTSSVNQELARRDFTINAMAYNHRVGLIDLFKGVQDIKNRIIRCVGNPYERFNEDALRMMRAVRFAAQLGFEIEKNTLHAIFINKDLLAKVSSERIMAELNKILLSDNPAKVEILFLTGLMNFIMPEFIGVSTVKDYDGDNSYVDNNGKDNYDNEDNKNNDYDDEDDANAIAWHNIAKSLNFIEPILHLRMTMLLLGLLSGSFIQELMFVDMQEKQKLTQNELSKISERILRRLKYDNHIIAKVSSLIKYCSKDIEDDKISVRSLLGEMGEELLKDLITVKKAIYKTRNKMHNEQENRILENVEKKINEIIINKECFTIKDLSINGCTLLEMGFKGVEIGNLLKLLLDKVIKDPGLNTNEKLIEILNTKVQTQDDIIK